MGLFLTVESKSQDQALLDQALASDASEHAATLAGKFAKARGDVLLLSRNPVFADFYDEPGSRADKVRNHTPSLARAESALGYLERLYPGSIGEACFIDRKGAENARVTVGEVAGAEELSRDERGNPFFSPTFGMHVGQVYQAAPYVSPDTGDWVVAVSTPVPSSDGVEHAIVHFEVTVDSFRSVLGDRVGGGSTVVVDHRTGAVIVESETPQQSGVPLGGGRQVRLPPGDSGHFELDGQRVAFHQVSSRQGDTNHWAVVTSETAPTMSLSAWVALTGLGVLGLAFLALAGRGFRAARYELENARDAAVNAARAKTDFLANMSHEIRTPMNGVIGLAGLLINTGLDQRQFQYADRLRNAGESLLAVVNDILDFSKIEAGKLELEDSDFDLCQLVGGTASLVAEEAQRKGVELVAVCSPGTCTELRGDRDRLGQVLLNLASNAVKFTESGEVILRARQVAESEGIAEVRFEVTDTGIGIAQQDRHVLFEAFSQADTSTTRRFGGTGLGLAISRQLVTAMGGELQLDSKLGSGSTFSFNVSLPLSSGGQRQLATATKTLAPPELLEGRRVLVVDDNETSRLVLGDQLRAWHMHTDLAPDAPSALEMMRSAARRGEPYEYVLLDLIMPDMGGLELAGRVRGDAEIETAHLILLTSVADLAEMEVRGAGIATSVAKPVRMSELFEALTQRAPSEPHQRPQSVAQAAASPTVRGHVLVAEDNFTNQLVAQGVLESLGYRVDVVDNGLEALDAMARATYSAVLMDCQMPELDGYSATEQIRQREGAARRTPVIAMTAGVMEGDMERCLAAGMDDYLSKPVKPAAVQAMLAKWVPPIADKQEAVALRPPTAGGR